MAWISKNDYLSLTEMQNNALEVRDWFQAGTVEGVTTNAVAAMLGNMQTESTINPGIWEGLKPYAEGGGYGLVQWTPYTKLTKWFGNDDVSKITGYFQCDRIWYEALNGLQWFSNPNAPIKSPPITLLEFMRSTLPPSILANYFLWYYEHPAETIQPARAEQANYWYKYLTGVDPPTPTPKRKSMPLWFFMPPW